MSGFRDIVEADLKRVFLQENEFAQKRTVKYDGEAYANIPVTITRAKEEDRQPKVDDHMQGLHLVTAILHCALSDIGGLVPEQDGKIWVSDGAFFQAYYITESGCEMGMVRLGLEAIDE